VTLLVDAVLATAAVFVAASLVALYRVVRGPTTADRVLAVNVAGTNAVVVIALVSAAIGEPAALDIALVYALLNFLLSIAVSKFAVERGQVM